jgi:hypothetical protein
MLDLRPPGYEPLQASVWVPLAGVVLGRNVADFDLRHAFRPVD